MQPGPKGFDYLVWTLQTNVKFINGIFAANFQKCKKSQHDDKMEEYENFNYVDTETCESSLDNINYSDTIKNLIYSKTVIIEEASSIGSECHNGKGKYRVTEV